MHKKHEYLSIPKYFAVFKKQTKYMHRKLLLEYFSLPQYFVCIPSMKAILEVVQEDGKNLEVSVALSIMMMTNTHTVTQNGLTVS